MWDFSFGENDSSDDEDCLPRFEVHKPGVGIATGGDKFMPGGTITYSRYPTEPKKSEPLPDRGLHQEVKLVKTKKTMLPQVIVRKYSGRKVAEQSDEKASLPTRNTGNFITSGRLQLFRSRLKDRNVPALVGDELASPGVTRGKANSSFHAGDFEIATRYLVTLAETKTLKADTKLLLLECLAYLGEPSRNILYHVGQFDETIKCCYRSVPGISLFHLLQWALELRHNDRHYGAIFVCSATSLTLYHLETNSEQYFLAYALFVEMALRVMSIMEQGPVINTVVINSMEQVLPVLYVIAVKFQARGRYPDWNLLAVAFNALAFFCNILGKYEKALEKVENGLSIIKLKLTKDNVVFPDLLINKGMAYVGQGNWRKAMKCFAKAVEAYRECETNIPYFRADFERKDMMERAEKSLNIVKQMLVSKRKLAVREDSSDGREQAPTPLLLD